VETRISVPTGWWNPWSWHNLTQDNYGLRSLAELAGGITMAAQKEGFWEWTRFSSPGAKPPHSPLLTRTHPHRISPTQPPKKRKKNPHTIVVVVII
jgi:hypothetical protein